MTDRNKTNDQMMCVYTRGQTFLCKICNPRYVIIKHFLPIIQLSICSVGGLRDMSNEHITIMNYEYNRADSVIIYLPKNSSVSCGIVFVTLRFVIV